MTRAWMIAAALLAFAESAMAQPGGGGRGGDRNRRIQWFEDLESAAKGTGEGRNRGDPQNPSQKKYIFVYVYPATETEMPTVFNNTDIVDLSMNSFDFVKIAFDKENEHLKAWKVTGAPVCLGLDRSGNDFNRIGSVSIDQIRALTKELPALIVKYETKLRSDYAKFLEALKAKDAAKIGKAMAEVLAGGKKGYKEVTETMAKAREIETEELKKVAVAENAGADAVLEYLEDMVRDYKGTPIAAEGEIRMAEIERMQGNPAAAIARLLKIAKLDPWIYKDKIDAAHKALEEISKEGVAKIDEAVKASSKDALRKIQKDYAGTDASKKAAEALKSLD